MRNATVLSRASLAAALVALAACSDFLDVTNPGPISDEALDDDGAMPGLVVGMAGDLAVSQQQSMSWGSVWGDGLRYAGTTAALSEFALGTIDEEDVGPAWNDFHRARWVAENGIERMQEVLGTEFSTSALAAEANVYAGYANRILGENVCNAVFDGGPLEDYTVHFTRAEEYFNQAMTLAQAAGKAEATPVLFAVDQFTEAEMDRIRNDTNLSGLEREVELARIELERLKATAQILGQPLQEDRPPSSPLPLRTHTLQAGDTIGALAQRYDVPVNVLLQANPVLLQPALLRPGTRVRFVEVP